jgi:hypothetical protein
MKLELVLDIGPQWIKTSEPDVLSCGLMEEFDAAASDDLNQRPADGIYALSVC